MFRLFLCFLCFCLTVTPVVAMAVTISQEDRISLESHVAYFEDPEGNLSLDEILARDPRWETNGESTFNRGYSGSAWWLRMSLTNPGPDKQRRLLEIGYPLLDDVQVFITQDGDVLQRYALGDLSPFGDRPVNNRFFVVPVEFQTEQSLDVFLRIKTQSSVQVPLMLWQPNALALHEVNTNIVQGLYYGAMLVIILYNLLIFLVLWDRSYLYYVGFVASMTMLMVSVSGQGFRYLWPDNVTLNDYAVALSISSIIIFANLFTARFLELPKRAPALSLMTYVLAALGLVGVILSVTIPYSLAMSYLVPLGLLSSLGNVIVGSVSWWRGVLLARYYCLAWALFLIGSVLMTLSKLTILPSNWFTNYSIQLGSVLEAVLLSFALAERINIERRLRLQAQEETISTVRRLNSELELRVEERTEDLEKLNQQLTELSNTDQLTRIPNRRQLETKLDSVWLQCAEQKRPMAVILLDIDFFKRVNDEYGHHAGDVCLQQVAAKISGCIHWDSDLLARYGGEEFCLVLPNTDSDDAMVIAERVRKAVAECDIRTENHTLNTTISLGVYVAIPDADMSAELALKQADIALYQSKENGRNRVTLFTPESA